MKEPKVGDLVSFDITWADTESHSKPIHIDRIQYGIITAVYKRARRAWDQYIIEWNGQDILFFGEIDKIEIIGD